MTEILLSTEPKLTGRQILQIHEGLLPFATKNGWIEG